MKHLDHQHRIPVGVSSGQLHYIHYRDGIPAFTYI